MYGDKSFWKVQNQASYSVVSELGVCVEWGEGCAFSEFTVHETKRLHIQNELIYFCKKKNPKYCCISYNDFSVHRQIMYLLSRTVYLTILDPSTFFSKTLLR